MPYELEYKRTVDSTWTVYSTTLQAANFPVSISGLVAGTQYDVRCRARDLSGNPSAYSSITQSSTVAAPDSTAPTAPVITATQTGPASASVALTTASTDIGGSGVATYAVEYKRNVDSTWTVATAAITAAQFPYPVSGLSSATLYDFRARATDVAGNVGAYSATSQATTGSQSLLALEPGTMLGKMMNNAFAPTGYAYSKHTSWLLHTPTGDMVQFGGDFPADSIGTESYRVDLYRYNIATGFSDTSNRSLGWSQELKYCAAAGAGGIQPKGADYQGWDYDPVRNVGIAMPGLYVVPGAAVCGGMSLSQTDDANYKSGHILKYNFGASLATRWTDYGFDTKPAAGGQKWGMCYDPTTQCVLRIRSEAGSLDTTLVDVLDWAQTVATGSQVYRTTVSMGTDGSGNNILAHNSKAALDIEGRWLYVYSYRENNTSFPQKIFRVNVDSVVAGSMVKEDLGAVPFTVSDAAVNGMIVWDSVNRRLVIFESSGSGSQSRLYFYNPITALWENSNYVASPSEQPWCRHALTFDKINNVVFLGGEQVHNQTDGQDGRFWVYRYQDSQPAYVTALAAGQVKHVVPASGLATPLDTMPAEWKQSLGGVSNGGTGGDGRSWIAAWSSSAIDQNKKIVYVTGGGHGDSANNMIGAVDLVTGVWSKEDGSALSATRPSSDTYADGRPTSVHVYDGWEFAAGKLWRSRGSQFSPGGSQTNIFWEYNPVTKGYTNHGAVGLDGGTLGDNMIYDPRFNRLLIMQVDHMKYRVWDIGSSNWLAGVVTAGDGNTGSNPPLSGGDPGQTNSAFDMKRGRVLMMGPGLMFRSDFNGTTLSIVGSVGSGADWTGDLQSNDNASLTYDEDLDCYWAFKAGNGDDGQQNKLFRIDPVTYAVTKYTLSGDAIPGGQASPYAGLPVGGFGLLQTIRGWNALSLVLRVDRGVFVIKKPNVGQSGLWH